MHIDELYKLIATANRYLPHRIELRLYHNISNMCEYTEYTIGFIDVEASFFNSSSRYSTWCFIEGILHVLKQMDTSYDKHLIDLVELTNKE